MKTIKGPALFLAQFAGDQAPFDSWDGITRWAADCGYDGVQVPSWDGRLFDLAKAAESKDYCDEFKGVAAENGVQVTELSTHLAGPACGGAPGLRRPPSTASPIRSVRGNPGGAAGLGGGAGHAGDPSQPQSRADRAGHLLRRAGLALYLSLAAAPGRPDRHPFFFFVRRACPPLAADPRPCGGARRRPVL